MNAKSLASAPPRPRPPLSVRLVVRLMRASPHVAGAAPLPIFYTKRFVESFTGGVSPASRYEYDTAPNFYRLFDGLLAPEDLAGMVADMRFHGLPDDFVETYAARVDAVTLDDVRQALAAHEPYDDLLFVLVAPAATVRSQLEGLGGIEVVPLQ